MARVRLIAVVSASHLEVASRGSHALSVLAQRQLETHRLQHTQVLSLLRCMHSSSVGHTYAIRSALEACIRSGFGQHWKGDCAGDENGNGGGEGEGKVECECEGEGDMEVRAGMRVRVHIVPECELVRALAAPAGA